MGHKKPDVLIELTRGLICDSFTLFLSSHLVSAEKKPLKCVPCSKLL